MKYMHMNRKFTFHDTIFTVKVVETSKIHLKFNLYSRQANSEVGDFSILEFPIFNAENIQEFP